MRATTRGVAVLAALGALLLSGCDDADVEAPAATVDGLEITDAQVAASANLFRFLAEVNQQPCGQLDPTSNETEASACNRFALTNLIEFRVTNAYAEANGIEAPADALDLAIEGLEQQLGPGVLDEQLAANSATREQLRGLASDFAVLREVATAVATEEIGNDELRARYEQDIATYTTVEVDHILVKSEGEADDVYADVTSPGATRDDFLALAEEVSIDPTAKENRGALGAVAASTYVPEFANAALDLEVGAISEPVQTEFGWHVIRLEDLQVTPFDEAKQGIVQESSPEVFADWLREELGEGLEVNPKYGRFDLETLTIQRIASTDPDAEPTQADDPVNVPASP